MHPSGSKDNWQSIVDYSFETSTEKFRFMNYALKAGRVARLKHELHSSHENLKFSVLEI